LSDDGPEWFAPKRYGYGPGLPVTWQGWAFMLSSIAITVGLCLALRDHPLQLTAALIPLIVAMLVIGCRKTRGGCQWRFGGED
jgi:hypothetical protein